MDEYIRKQAVLNLIDEFQYNHESNTWGVTKDGVIVLKPDTLDKLHEAVKAMPADDAVEVVRCKDCVKNKKCMLYSDYRFPFFEQDFCSYGWDGEE